MDFSRRIRQIEKQTGAVITVSGSWTEHGKFITATDPDLDRTFSVSIRLASQGERALRDLHNQIYRARGEAVYLKQGRKCALCGDRINSYEIDHIQMRGRVGRNDRVSNLRALCPSLRKNCHRTLPGHGG